MDWTPYINTGLTVLSMVLIGSALIISMRSKVGELTSDMTEVKRELRQLVELQIQQGRHDERMNATDQRVLSQGRRLDEFMKGQSEASERMARMVELTIGRVNMIVDQRARVGEESGRG